MKTTRHSLMAKGILVLLSLLVLIFVFTYAWFVDADAPAVANGLSLTTETDYDFEMALGFTTPETAGNYWISDFMSDSGGKIDFERINVPVSVTLGSTTITNTGRVSGADPCNLLADFKPIDLTGDGVTLYRPEMMPKNRSIDFTATAVDKNIIDNKQYIAFDLYVRSTNPGFSVRLDKESFVVAAAEVNDHEIGVLATEVSNGTVTPSLNHITADKTANYNKLRRYPSDSTTKVTRESSYGHFSEDSVVGATPFTQYDVTSSDFASFFGNSYSLDPAKSLLWIPRYDIYLQDTTNTNDWTLYTETDSGWDESNVVFQSGDEMNSGRTITYEEAAAEHRYYDETKINNLNHAARFSTKTAVTDIESADNTVIINAASYGNSSIYDGTYYYGKCRVNLWIEGCDAEARRAIDGGSFFFGFDLTAN